MLEFEWTAISVINDSELPLPRFNIKTTLKYTSYDSMKDLRFYFYVLDHADIEGLYQCLCTVASCRAIFVVKDNIGSMFIVSSICCDHQFALWSHASFVARRLKKERYPLLTHVKYILSYWPNPCIGAAPRWLPFRWCMVCTSFLLSSRVMPPLPPRHPPTQCPGH